MAATNAHTTRSTNLMAQIDPTTLDAALADAVQVNVIRSDSLGQSSVIYRPAD